MSGGTVIIHHDGGRELFDNVNFNNITVQDLLMCARGRIYGEFEELLTDVNNDFLCEGPYLRKPLDDHRLREIVEMVQENALLESFIKKSETEPTPVELWLCDYTNNGFSFENSSTTGEQNNSGDTRPINNSDNSKGMHLQINHPESGVPQPPCTEMDSAQRTLNQHTDDVLAEVDQAAYACLESLKKASESCNTSNESFNDNVFKFTNGFRTVTKVEFRTDIFPTNKSKKAKKSKSTNTKATTQTASRKSKSTNTTATSQTVNKKRKSTNMKATSQTVNKKRRVYKKYAFHLQAIEFKKGRKNGRHPHIQPSQHYRDLMQKGQPMWVFVAATKNINGRRYLDALKGFLCDKKNPKIPLENPYIIKFEWTNRKIPLPKDFPLKLALIQVSGDINRKCTVEYNENFDFAQRKVAEISKRFGHDTTDNTDEPEGDVNESEDDIDGTENDIDEPEGDVNESKDDMDGTENDIDEPEEFQIVIIPVKDRTLLKADWPMLIESDPIHYKISKSNKKQKTKEDEEYDEDDDNDDDKEEEDDDEDYADE